MSQIAETTSMVFTEDGHTDDEVKVIRIRLIQMVHLVTRLAVVTPDVEKIERR